MLHIVAATRHDAQAFQRDALLYRSLARLQGHAGVRAEIVPSNTRGLPEIYNAALARVAEDDVLLFTHDDVWLDDWFVPQRLHDALARFAVVGVAGNRRRVPRQPSWLFLDTAWTRDTAENLSGAVAHGPGPPGLINYYGRAPARVRLLDGVFLAARAGTLRRAKVAFDPRFTFHFYDLDFCRSCEQAGLELGAWPIALTHASVGNLGTSSWRQGYADYLAKWAE